MRLIVCPRSGTSAGSGTELPPPPKDRPPHWMSGCEAYGAPVAVKMSPQSPVAATVEKLRNCSPLQHAATSVVDVEPPVVVVDVVDGVGMLVVLLEVDVVGRTVLDVVSGGSVGGRQPRHGLQVTAHSEPRRHGLQSVEQ